MESNLEEDVPPLEDMTEYVERLKMVDKDQRDKHPTKQVDSSLLRFEEEEERPKVVDPELLVINKEERQRDTPFTSNGAVSRTEPKNVKPFGGMKKGFLSGSSSSAEDRKRKSNATKKKSSDIPFLQKTKENNDNLRFKEVQEELKKTHPLLATKDWMTEDLLSKIDSNPVLARAFSDPKLFKVLEEFHKNPQQALMAAQSNPEVKEFLQQFCSIMGDHFTSLADAQAKGERPLVSEQQLSSEDDRDVQKLLSNPDIKSALLDPDIIKLMELLKSNPHEAQRFLDSVQSKPSIRSKVMTLVENGLLSIDRT